MRKATCRECDLLTSPSGPEDSDDVQAIALGIYWLAFALFAILLAVFVVAMTPHGNRSHPDQLAVEREVEVELCLFFSVLIGARMTRIVVRYR